MTVLLASIALFMLFWFFVLRGVVALRNARMQGWISLVLLSLPTVFLVMRVVTQGESRKRSALDFVLAAFAALGVAALRRRNSNAQEVALDAQESVEA